MSCSVCLGIPPLCINCQRRAAGITEAPPTATEGPTRIAELGVNAIADGLALLDTRELAGKKSHRVLKYDHSNFTGRLPTDRLQHPGRAAAMSDTPPRAGRPVSVGRLRNGGYGDWSLGSGTTRARWPYLPHEGLPGADVRCSLGALPPLSAFGPENRCTRGSRNPIAARSPLLSCARDRRDPAKLVATSWLRIRDCACNGGVHRQPTEPKVGSSNLSGRAKTGWASSGIALQIRKNSGRGNQSIGVGWHSLAAAVRPMVATELATDGGL